MNENMGLFGFLGGALDLFAVRDRATLEQWLILIPLFPLIGFLFNGLFGHRLDKKTAGWIGVFASLASFVWATLCIGAINTPLTASPDTRNVLHAVYAEWIPTAEFSCSFGLYLDQLSALMVLIITGIGMLIHIYSLGYMAHDKGVSRFFAYLNLFLFSMLILVLGDNLIMTFVGWEGVGLCSYLLIGFWYEDPANAAAGMKAFVVNRIGDLGFLLGIFTLIAAFGTVNFVAKPEQISKSDRVTRVVWSEEGTLKTTHEFMPENSLTRQTYLDNKDANGQENFYVRLPKEQPGLLDYGQAIRLLNDNQPNKNRMEVGYKDPGNSNLDLSKTMAAKVWPGWTINALLTLACMLLFVGAMGKSAQIPLYVWLPDAMAGPTPVSALIHAATMVTSGIYMICRLHSLFACSEDALRIIAVVGGATALLAALIGLTQLDIKKVLAYSTVSQLGYMFLGLGVGMFSLGIFHVMTHAFFKALLFLGAGSVIHGMSGEQDMRYMGGLRKKMPKTFWVMLIGALALAGMWPLAGWWSKDAILAETLIKYENSHNKTFLILWIMGCIGAFCTAFYTFRLIGLTFFGESRAKKEVQDHIHESPPSMILPLIVLAALSLVGGLIWHENFSSEGAPKALGIHNVVNTRISEATVHHAHSINLIVTTVITLVGIGLGLFMYGKGQRIPNPAGTKNFFYRLSLNKFYVDETYNVLIVMPFVIGSEIVHWVVEMLFIDLIVTGFGYAVGYSSTVLRRIQTGLLNTYAFAILFGTLAVLYFVLRQILPS